MPSVERGLDLWIDGSINDEFTVGTEQDLGFVSVVLLVVDGEHVLGDFLFDDVTSAVKSSFERDFDFLIDGSVKNELTAGTPQELGLVSTVLVIADKVVLREVQ